MFRVLTLSALMCISAASIRAQGTNEKTAYVPNASTSSSFPQDDQQLNKRLAEAAVVFLEVRLNSLKDLHVQRRNSPCAGQSQVQPTESRPQSPPLGSDLADSYEVITTIRTLGVSALNENEKELVLDYRLVKYVKCIPTTLVHRSEPISEKTAFEGFVQMGDVLEVKLRNELAPAKISIEVAGISSQSESSQPIKEDLTNRLFIRLASESDFRVRDIRGGQPSPDADYVVTGVLTKDAREVRFTIRNVKDESKSQSFSVPVPADQKNIQAFYKAAAETVVNYIRVCPLKPLADDEIASTLNRVSELLCKNRPVCNPQPIDVTEAIFHLTRLNCKNKTSAILTLLGDAYVLSEDFLKAADAYDQAVKLISPERTDEIVATNISAGNAWYQAQNYRNAAHRYELAIAKSPDLQPPSEAVYLQRARSYRFGSDKQAFTAALDGLSKYSTSEQLATEVSLAFNNLPGDQLPGAYDLVLKSINLDALPKVLPGIQQSFANYLLEEAFEKIFDKKNVIEVDRLLKVVETLPLASFPQELKDAYKIMRAVWQKDARNDFQNAVMVLTPFSEQTSKAADAARYFLAHTYYERARRGNSKADYEKSVTLFKQVIEKGLFFDDYWLYPYLITANHELGSDQETRNYLEQKLKENPADVNAGEALVSLCVNHLKDLECANQNITKFESGPYARGMKLRKLELLVLQGQYQEAEQQLAIVSQVLNSDEVTLFYQIWILYALARENDAQSALRRWQSQMEEIRRSGDSRPWLFDAAKRTLDTAAKLSTSQKDQLRNMISAMESKVRTPPATAVLLF